MDRKKVLMIEDDAFFAKILAQHLIAADFEVIHATNGEDGVQQAIDEQPDAIVLDVDLPKKDGFEALEELKAHPETRTIPVMMLTSLSAREDIARCFKHGACEYFIKAHHGPEEVVKKLQAQFFA